MIINPKEFKYILNTDYWGSNAKSPKELNYILVKDEEYSFRINMERKKADEKSLNLNLKEYSTTSVYVTVDDLINLSGKVNVDIISFLKRRNLERF
jgi:hypothetical protein